MENFIVYFFQKMFKKLYNFLYINLFIHYIYIIWYIYKYMYQGIKNTMLLYIFFNTFFTFFLLWNFSIYFFYSIDKFIFHIFRSKIFRLIKKYSYYKTSQKFDMFLNFFKTQW